MTAISASVPRARRSYTMRLYKSGAVEAPLDINQGRALLRRRTVQFADVVPVDQILPERLEIVGPPVAVIDVIGMLPDVAAENRRCALDQRAFSVGGLVDDELAVLHRDPAPARAELGDARLDEIFLGLGGAAEIGIDLGLEAAGNLVAAAARLHPLPEMSVIVVLACVVEEAGVLAVRALHDLFERLVFPLGALEQVVAVVDVGEVLLVVV